MSGIAARWPAVRVALYSVSAAVLAVGSVFGFVSDSQSAAVLEVIGQVLGVVGLLLAQLFVPRPDLDPAGTVSRETPPAVSRETPGGVLTVSRETPRTVSRETVPGIPLIDTGARLAAALTDVLADARDQLDRFGGRHE